MEQILEILANSPQVIVVIKVAIIVLAASVINLLVGMQNMKMAKALKIENEQNKKKMLEKFIENWNKAENLIRGQSRQEAVPISKELAVPNPLLQLTVQSQGYSREIWQERDIYSQLRKEGFPD